MKRALGAMAMNWLRKPENQERIKRTARDVWGRFQQRRNGSTADKPGSGDQSPSTARPARNTPPNGSDNEPR
jgi:hypothetical protein